MALGYTLQLPEEDRFLMSKNDLLDKICVLFGGRVAEELHFGDVTTGASNDLERATQIARQMVTEFGMSEKLGLVKLGHKHNEVFLGRDIGEDRNYSDAIAYSIDQEVKAIVDYCYEKVRTILLENEDEMKKVATTLLEREVIEGKDLNILLGIESEENGITPSSDEQDQQKGEEPVSSKTLDAEEESASEAPLETKSMPEDMERASAEPSPVSDGEIRRDAAV